MSIRKYLSAISLFLFFGFSFNLQAGQLSDFEESAKAEKKTKPKNSSKTHNSNSSSNPDSISGQIKRDIAVSVAEAIAKGIGYTFLAGTTMSAVYTARAFDENALPTLMKPDEDSDKDDFLHEGRDLGSQFLPIVRFDYSYGNLNRGITLRDYDIELGAAFLSANYKRSIFFEESNNDRLTINQAFVNYRLSFTKYVQVNLGLGNYEINGKSRRNSGAFKWGFGIYPKGGIGFEADFSSMDYPLSVEDSEYSIHYDGDYWAVRAGFRILETPETSLNGFFTGLSLSF